MASASTATAAVVSMSDSTANAASNSNNSASSLLLSWDERATAQATLDAAQEQLQSLCASHAGTFVAVERRGRETLQALQDLQERVQTTLKQDVLKAQRVLEQQQQQEGEDVSEELLGKIDEKDGTEVVSLAVLSARHRVRRRTLLQHASLLELLELPSLMDACVRSQQYDDALSLAALANTLERRHHNDENAVVMHVIAQLRTRQADLRRHLLHRLQSHVHMPACLEVVTALRRLNNITLEHQTTQNNLERVFTAMEIQLQLDFLEARDVWIDSLVPAASSNTANTLATSTVLFAGYSEQLLDTIDRYRTRIFEVATQYNAIFRAQSKSSDMSVFLLSAWLTRRIDAFLRLLQHELQDTVTDTAALRDIWDASVFFASSLGRLGADFSARLAPLFESRMLTLVTQPWQDGITQWRETLHICVDVGVSTPLIATDPEEDVAVDLSVALNEPQPPPRILLSTPPLARVVNSVLTGLNELRRCLLPELFTPLRSQLDETLQTIKTILLTSERQVLQPGRPKELRQAMAQLLLMLKDVVDPYLRGSLEAALGCDTEAEKYHTIMRKKLIKEKEVVAEEVAKGSNKNDDTDNMKDDKVQANEEVDNDSEGGTKVGDTAAESEGNPQSSEAANDDLNTNEEHKPADTVDNDLKNFDASRKAAEIVEDIGLDESEQQTNKDD